MEIKHVKGYLDFNLKIINTDLGFINEVKGIQTDGDIIHP